MKSIFCDIGSGFCFLSFQSILKLTEPDSDSVPNLKKAIEAIHEVMLITHLEPGDSLSIFIGFILNLIFSPF